MNIDKIWQSAVHTLDEHKATDIKVLGVGSITSIADYFLIASGNSANQVRSLADYVEEALAKEDIRPLRNEGYNTGDWVTLDYGDVLIHVFRRETRDFYDLERLWVDATDVDITPYLMQQ
ncbi:MAG: ribosome silencing factor [Clostridia bacterium]|nr:ribosome silencing factor [Clostridia bacterium]